jgi:hypothetical protein
MAYIAFTQAVVTVNAAAKGAFRVVQVHTAQVLEPNDALKFGKGFFGRFGGAQIVACGKGVTGIDADTYAGFILDARNDLGQMFEFKSEVAALTGGVFDDSGHPFGFVQRDVDRFGDARQAGGLLNLR